MGKVGKVSGDNNKNECPKVNVACGGTYITGDGWINFDYVASSASVCKADLLARLPLAENSATLVYSSHFLEHVPRSDVPVFLRECLRVLRPGAVLRLVLPDLEEMARTYLALRDAGKHEKADFLVLEMIDQCVRRESGGELGRLCRRLRAASTQESEMIRFVRERNGENLTGGDSTPESGGGAALSAVAGRYLRGARHRFRRVWLRLCVAGLPAAFLAQNSVLRASASAITGSGTSISCNRHSRWPASRVWNAARPAAARPRISPSTRSTSTPTGDRGRVPCRGTWRRETAVRRMKWKAR